MNITWNMIQDIELGGVKRSDYPDMVDAFVQRATIKGVECDDVQIDFINEKFSEEIQELARESLF